VNALAVPWIPWICILTAKHPRTSRSQVFFPWLPSGLARAAWQSCHLGLFSFFFLFSFPISASPSHSSVTEDYCSHRLRHSWRPVIKFGLSGREERE
jgi:hypothetical protein